jgi:hypothetical protein
MYALHSRYALLSELSIEEKKNDRVWICLLCE